jgi:hypothetical protein
MKLSFCTDSLGHLPFEAMLDRLGEQERGRLFRYQYFG